MKKQIYPILLFLLILSACKSPAPTQLPTQVVENTPVVTQTPSPSPTATETSVPPTRTPRPTRTSSPGPIVFGPDNFPEDVNPLTGLYVEDLDLLNRLPVAVKVQTFPRGQRPPYGVSLADIVFDYYQNFGQTRFNAIYYGQNAERVSPIRSGRLPDYQIVQMYKALFAFSGADAKILDRLLTGEVGSRMINRVSAKCPPAPLCRLDTSRYNFLMTDTALFSQWAEENNYDNQRPDLDGMRFEEVIPQGGGAGEQVFVRYNANTYVRWDYDKESGGYLRFVDTKVDDGSGEVYAPMMDGLTEEQIVADNVVVLFAPHSYAFNTSPGITEIIDIQLSGTGKAYAFRDGQRYEATWNRPTADSVLYLTFPDGSRYAYKPGSTWYQIVGQYSTVAEDDEGVWRVTFSIP